MKFKTLVGISMAFVALFGFANIATADDAPLTITSQQCDGTTIPFVSVVFAKDGTPWSETVVADGYGVATCVIPSVTCGDDVTVTINSLVPCNLGFTYQADCTENFNKDWGESWNDGTCQVTAIGLAGDHFVVKTTVGQ